MRALSARPGGRWRRLDETLALPESPGVAMLAAPSVFWVRATDNIARSVRDAMDEPPEARAGYVDFVVPYVWWHACNRQTADRWAAALRRRLGVNSSADIVALEHLH